jgi:hypothetical protein
MASIQKSVDAYKTIHHDYQQLANVNRVLTDCTESLNTTQKSRKEIAKLTKLSLEVLEIVGQNTEAGLKRLAPSHSFGVAMKSNEAEKRRELAEETGTVMIEKDPVKILREFVKRKKSTASAKHATAAVVSPSPKKARRSKRQKSSQNDEHPHTPDNGKLFLPIELYNILSPLDAGDRSSLASYFVEKDWLHHKGKDPSRGVRKFMQKASANPDRIQSYWSKGGRPAVCDKKRFEEKHKEHLQQNLGMMVGLDKVRQWLKEIKEEQIVKDGGVPTEEDLKVPESTARDYHAKIVYSNSAELVPHSVQTSSSSATVPRKPDNRHTMERSLISAMKYALVVSATHAIPADEQKRSALLALGNGFKR